MRSMRLFGRRTLVKFLVFAVYIACFSNIFALCYHSRNMALPCGPASRNKDPILNILHPAIEQLRIDKTSRIRVLEIASGTGEHAAHFSSQISNVVYQPTEPEISMHESISSWCNRANVLPPFALDVNEFVNDSIFPAEFQGMNIDAMICINMIHISPWQSTLSLFRVASNCLRAGGFLLTYGPYKQHGEMVESNMKFDESLKQRCETWGIREIDDVESAADTNGLSLESKHDMPANNLCLIFRKR